MKLSYLTGSRILGVALLAGLWGVACSSDEGDDSIGTGGAGVGGKASTSTGGKSGATGGKSSTSTAKTGGAPGTGGAVATGGASGTGTAKTGGASSMGGVTSTGTTRTGGATSASAGGVTSVGGNTAAGGTTSPGSSTVVADAGICDGCLTLFVPLAAEKTGTEFEADFGAGTPEDFSTSVITARVYVEPSGNTGGLRLYAKNDTTYQSVYGTWTNLTDLKNGWHEIELDLAATASLADGGTGFDKANVRWIGVNVSAGDSFDGAVFDDVTVYVDWIKFSDGAHPDYTFDDNAIQGFSINKYNSPVAGSLLNGAPVPG